MKQLTFIAFLLLSVSAAKAATPLSQLLSLYYDVKNALVNSDAKTSATKAGEFVKALNGVDMQSLSEEAHKVFMPLKNQLLKEAGDIAASDKLDQQRELFKSFSNDVYTLAKGVKLSDQPVYQEYCPMEKSYWLSNEAAIKNPYFGSQMLNCGKVTDTLK